MIRPGVRGCEVEAEQGYALPSLNPLTLFKLLQTRGGSLPSRPYFPHGPKHVEHEALVCIRAFRVISWPWLVFFSLPPSPLGICSRFPSFSSLSRFSLPRLSLPQLASFESSLLSCDPFIQLIVFPRIRFPRGASSLLS